MEALIFVLTLVGLVVAFDFAALAFGFDSRDTIGDDHGRPVQGRSGW
jgi:hypothetical protein